MLVLLHLFALFLLVGLGFYVFVASPRNRTHQTFAAFIFFLALWTIKEFDFLEFQRSTGFAGLWASTSFVIALLMQTSLVVFAWVFPENSPIPLKKTSILFAPSLILIPVAFLGFLWHEVGFVNGKFSIDLAPSAYAFVTYIYIVFGYGTFILFQKYKKYRGTQQGQQIGAIFTALIITAIFKTFANLFFPFFNIYELLPFSAIFVLPGVLIYAYAISNFNFSPSKMLSINFDFFRLHIKLL